MFVVGHNYFTAFCIATAKAAPVHYQSLTRALCSKSRMYRVLLLLIAAVVVSGELRVDHTENTMAVRSPLFNNANGAARAACTEGATAEQMSSRIADRMKDVRKEKFTWLVTVTPTGASTGSRPTPGKNDQIYAADCNGQHIRIHGRFTEATSN
ncbi:uncharacterized protein LOC129592729 [Paramacrobiotus metropolitanus]|uniref:uncharacterized protein LOC129592729 n=1 Tax=Paramacrobiotus metropolitanus TaxID=2943436 RepID=UPI002445AEA2|nr:uncharacterized protein LOC129592729 [Paramacrobiotus metropolitanus]